MAYVFAPGVSACEVDGRLVVLDLRSDRYLMLPKASEMALKALVAGEEATSTLRAACDALREQGLVTLAPDPAANVALCGSPRPTKSFLEQPWRRPSLRALLSGMLAIVRAAAGLRWRGLAREIAALPPGPARPHDRSAHDADRHAALFAELRLWVGPLDRCLPLSLALARRARRVDTAVRLVLGVKLGPFAAHAWVQRGDVVLNDRLDAVSAFTPILVA